MLRPLKLLAPALIPSWNFFDVIAPSPRIEYALTDGETSTAADWREFRPRPAQLSPLAFLIRLVWNPRWNESLYLVSCAERLVDEPTVHSETEILRRIAADLTLDPDAARLPQWLAFRLLFLRQEGDAVVGELLYQSAPRRREALA